MLPLRELQYSFFRSLATSPGASSGFEPILLDHVEGNSTLGPEERINIYAQMYFARLVEVLSQNFPRVFDILGFERFQDLVRAYIAQQPSVYPTIQDLGEHFSDFVAAHDVTQTWPFLGDLTRLEWLRLEVFDAPDAESLRLEDLQNIPPDEWPDLVFQLIPASQMLDSAWPVHSVWLAEDADQPKTIQPEETAVRIWRHELLVYQAPMQTTQKIALAAVRAGESFAGVCAALEAVLPAEEAPQVMGSLLLRWIEDGLLAKL